MRQMKFVTHNRMKLSTQRKVKEYLFIVPALSILVFAVVYPWIWSLSMSFSRWQLSTGAAPTFIGLRNYTSVLQDEKFYLALKNSLVFMVLSVSIQFICGLGIALLLNRALPARKLLMMGILLPYMLTPTMVGLVWKMLLHSNWGVVNYYLRALGVGSIDWLGSPNTTMYTLTIIATWLHTPWVTLMLFAGLQAIPAELIEAARVDGASQRQIFFHVTLPMLRSLIAIVLLFRIVFSFREFDVIYSMYNSGGPGNSAMVLGVYLYQTFSGSWDIGRSSAISFIMLTITIVLSLPVIFQHKGEKL